MRNNIKTKLTYAILACSIGYFSSSLAMNSVMELRSKNIFGGSTCTRCHENPLVNPCLSSQAYCVDSLPLCAEDEDGDVQNFQQTKRLVNSPSKKSCVSDPDTSGQTCNNATEEECVYQDYECTTKPIDGIWVLGWYPTPFSGETGTYAHECKGNAPSTCGPYPQE